MKVLFEPYYQLWNASKRLLINQVSYKYIRDGSSSIIAVLKFGFRETANYFHIMVFIWLVGVLGELHPNWHPRNPAVMVWLHSI